jgi:tRNA threonylcarbamoyladenosine biosynthesis protein TsaB
LALGLNIPLIGIPTLDALAQNVPYPMYQVCPVLDARKKEVYSALFQCEDDVLVRKSPYQVISPAELVNQIHEKTIMLGDAIDVYREFFKKKLRELVVFAPDAQRLPRAAVVAEMGLAKLKAGEVLDLASSEPFYIRDSDAQIC